MVPLFIPLPADDPAAALDALVRLFLALTGREPTADEIAEARELLHAAPPVTRD